MKIFAIRDIKAESFGRPFFSVNPPMAMRELQTVVNEPGNSMATYAEDFQLFLIGEFDEITGKIVSDEPHHICSIQDLVNKETDGP